MSIILCSFCGCPCNVLDTTYATCPSCSSLTIIRDKEPSMKTADPLEEIKDEKEAKKQTSVQGLIPGNGGNKRTGGGGDNNDGNKPSWTPEDFFNWRSKFKNPYNKNKKSTSEST